MAALITTTFRLNGSRHFVAHIQIVGDAAGDLANQPIIDSLNAIAGVQVSAGLTNNPTLWKITVVDWEFTGFTGTLTWDGATPQNACALPQYDGRMDFLEDGAPIVNGATTPTGKLLLTTNGLSAGHQGTIVIKGYHK